MDCIYTTPLLEVYVVGDAYIDIYIMICINTLFD